MKIYILPVDDCFQPNEQVFNYPAHNKDYGVEQDFLKFLQLHPNYVTSKVEEADWHYLPIFWTRWHLNHDYGRLGNEELQNAVSLSILDDDKTFTICQYDDGPLVDLGCSVQFLSSRKTSYGRDIPLLCSPHRFSFIPVRKKYTASFVGRLSTHQIRSQMAKELEFAEDFLILDGDFGSKLFRKKLQESIFCLAPRGYGGSSFRFYESLQMGIFPILIGDIDTRPFKQFLPWDDFSLYVDDVSLIKNAVNARLDRVKNSSTSIIDFYNQNLTYQKWCYLLIEELKNISYGEVICA